MFGRVLRKLFSFEQVFQGNLFRSIITILFYFLSGLILFFQESRKESFSDYITFAIVSSILIGMLPMLFRAYQSHVVICFTVFLCVCLTAYPSFNKEVMCFSTRVTNADNFIVFFIFLQFLYLESRFLSVAYLTVANLARLGISVHCQDSVRSHYLVRLFSQCWITGGHTIHPPVRGLLPQRVSNPYRSEIQPKQLGYRCMLLHPTI